MEIGAYSAERMVSSTKLAVMPMTPPDPRRKRRDRGFYLVCRTETAVNPAVQSFIKWIEARRDD